MRKNNDGIYAIKVEVIDTQQKQSSRSRNGNFDLVRHYQAVMSFPVLFTHDDFGNGFELVLLDRGQPLEVAHVVYQDRNPGRRTRSSQNAFSSSVFEPVEHRMFAAKKVSDNVPIGIRIPNLAWEHHQIVASLDYDQQREWLEMASDGEWPVARYAGN